MKTQAEKIALQFSNDGSIFIDAAGQNIADVCSRIAVREAVNPVRSASRYIFADSSVITITDDAWDVGYPDCSCWYDIGHDDRYCELSTEV